MALNSTTAYTAVLRGAGDMVTTSAWDKLKGIPMHAAQAKRSEIVRKKNWVRDADIVLNETAKVEAASECGDGRTINKHTKVHKSPAIRMLTLIPMMCIYRP